MLIAALTLLVILSAFSHIRAEYKGPPHHIYLFKPLTMGLILLIAMLGQAAAPVYKGLIIAGLFVSLVGDVFLMLPSDRFVSGLIAFLMAHFFYCGAFASQITQLAWWPLFPLLIYGSGVYIILLPHLGKLKWPVVIYGVAILLMAWLAWAHWSQTNQQGPLLALIGAMLFVISDTSLALNRFRGRFKLAQALTLGTYFTAQWLIASSVGQLW